MALTALLGVALASSCHGGPASYIVVEPSPSAPDATAPVRDAADADSVVTARFHRVRFHMWPGVALDLDDLAGRMHSTRRDGVVSFDDKTSFVLAIDTGEVGLPVDDLARLMNTYVFAYRGAPLRDLSFTTDGGHLAMAGVLHKVVDIPFSMLGDVSATPAGEIRVHPVSMTICTIPGEGLMHAVGVTLATLLDVRRATGVRVDGNDLLLDPTALMPPPAIAGHLTRASIAPGRLVQYFGADPAQHQPTERQSTERAATVVAPDTVVPNYMQFRGGTLKFGKLFMVHADMEVIDLAPGDPFDFDLAQYHAQLVAGFHRTRPDDGLLVFMPDLRSLTARGRAVARAP